MGKRLWDLAKSRIEIGTILPGHRHKVAHLRRICRHATVRLPSRLGRLHAKGYTLAHHLQSGSPGRSAHGGGTPGPGQPAVTRLSA